MRQIEVAIEHDCLNQRFLGRKAECVIVLGKKRTRKVGIGFITGRKSFHDVLTTYMNCWGDYVLPVGESVELSLFVAYDLDYNNTSRNDYTNINIELREALSEIHFIDRASIQAEATLLTEKGVVTKKEAALFFDKGYAGKRNAILYMAVKHGLEAMLFLDDDEYPLAVQGDNASESWTGQQILTTHLKYIEQADITNGHHCGYVSPIPTIGFNSTLTEDDFRIFIEAISNDIINWESIKSLMRSGNITYARPDVISGNAVKVEQIDGSKFVSGSNLCVNLKNPAGIPPFYNPPGARGEDAFLATCLLDRKVLRVPCYTFHDGFSVYTSMLHGVLPRKLKHVSAGTKRVADRFCNTCVGWIRYKPLLMYITRRKRLPRDHEGGSGEPDADASQTQRIFQHAQVHDDFERAGPIREEC